MAYEPGIRIEPLRINILERMPRPISKTASDTVFNATYELEKEGYRVTGTDDGPNTSDNTILIVSGNEGIREFHPGQHDDAKRYIRESVCDSSLTKAHFTVVTPDDVIETYSKAEMLAEVKRYIPMYDNIAVYTRGDYDAGIEPLQYYTPADFPEIKDHYRYEDYYLFPGEEYPRRGVYIHVESGQEADIDANGNWYIVNKSKDISKRAYCFDDECGWEKDEEGNIIDTDNADTENPKRNVKKTSHWYTIHSYIPWSEEDGITQTEGFEEAKNQAVRESIKIARMAIEEPDEYLLQDHKKVYVYSAQRRDARTKGYALDGAWYNETGEGISNLFKMHMHSCAHILTAYSKWEKDEEGNTTDMGKSKVMDALADKGYRITYDSDAGYFEIWDKDRKIKYGLYDAPDNVITNCDATDGKQMEFKSVEETVEEIEQFIAKDWREPVGRGWATSYGESLGMSQNAKDMTDDGGMLLSVWNGMSDDAKRMHIYNAYAQNFNDYPEILESIPFGELRFFMTEQPHHIEIPWWMNEGYDSWEDLVESSRESLIDQLEYDLTQTIDEYEIADLRGELTAIRTMSVERYYSAYEYDAGAIRPKEDTDVVWERFIIFDGQKFNDWVENRQ